MNLSTLWGGFRVFQKGAELANAELWKNAAACTTALVVFLNVLVPFIRSLWPDMPDLTAEQIHDIAAGISALGGIVVGLLTLATSKRVGIGTAKPLPEEATTTGIGPDAERAKVEPIDDNARKAGL